MTWVRTYADDCLAREPADLTPMTAAQWQDKCLAEMIRGVRFFYMLEEGDYARCAQVTHVFPARRIINRDGFTPTGEYFGTGMPVFELEIHLVDATGWTYRIWHTVRALDRKSLRAELSRIFTHAKISR